MHVKSEKLKAETFQKPNIYQICNFVKQLKLITMSKSDSMRIERGHPRISSTMKVTTNKRVPINTCHCASTRNMLIYENCRAFWNREKLFQQNYHMRINGTI